MTLNSILGNSLQRQLIVCTASRYTILRISNYIPAIVIAASTVIPVTVKYV
jgi:hypothetical protein